MMEPMASSPEPVTASQRVYDWVKTRILDGTYPGGMLLSEGEVGDAVGVSRTPVREAFLQLAAQEMLALYPKRGALVLSVSIPELREVLSARALIEPWAARAAARRADRAGLVGNLRQLIDQATGALHAGDDSTFQEVDRTFHELLLEAADNRLLTSFYSTLRDRQLRGGSVALRNHPERGVETMAQHAAITDAIEAGDFDQAAAFATAHVRDTTLALGLTAPN
jgi:DNA-binding GntR family transcriptional regulator